MLEVRNLSAAYGQHPALNNVSLSVNPGEIVVILGANGAGKSTLLRSISGICEGRVEGEVLLSGQSLKGNSSDEIVERGIALVPEGRGIFGDLTVKENLLLGAYPARARRDEQANMERVLRLFPKLLERQSQVARTMSGGEQQMVAIGRAMMSAPEILMLDEPSLGLSPLLCKELFQNLAQVKALGIGVLLVEQNAKQSLAIADRGYLLENTQITHEDTADRLANDPAVQNAYLGANTKAVASPAARTAAIEVAPAMPASNYMATPRRTAEEQIGISIDDIVDAAARQSAEAPAAAFPGTAAAASRLAQDRLSVVIKDIESAAKSARARRPQSAADLSKPQFPKTQNRENEDAPPPIIEVYRRPIVEVYRRRPSGQFERD